MASWWDPSVSVAWLQLCLVACVNDDEQPHARLWYV